MGCSTLQFTKRGWCFFGERREIHFGSTNAIYLIRNDESVLVEIGGTKDVRVIPASTIVGGFFEYYNGKPLRKIMDEEGVPYDTHLHPIKNGRL